MNAKKCVAAAGLSMLGIAGLAAAQPVIDGASTTANEYNQILWVNDANPTGFGDSNLGMIDRANGSEIDGVYARIADDAFGEPTLYMLVTGNLESNFNHLEVFIDSVAGGENRIGALQSDVDYGALKRMGDDGTGNGLTFDAGFEADYYFGVTSGGDPVATYANFSLMANELGGYYLGTGLPATSGLSGGDNPFGIDATVNNSNVGGVTDTKATRANLVATGWEFSIPLFAIGSPTGDFKVTMFINGAGHDFLASQVAVGGAWGANNLGEPRVLNFANECGNQFMVVDNGTNLAGLRLVENVYKAGGNASIQAVGANANQSVKFFYSLTGCGSTDVGGGVIIDLNNARLLGSANANAQGVATLTRTIPANARGQVASLQALAGTNKSNVTINVIQ